MNKQALQQKADALQKELDELKAEIEKPEDNDVLWMPDDGEKYYAYSFYSDSMSLKIHNIQKTTDIDKALGTLAKTKEESQAKLDALLTRQKILGRIAELNDGWWPDWSDGFGKWFPSSAGFKFSIFVIDQTMASEKVLKNEYLSEKLISEFTPDQLKTVYW